MPDSLGDQHQGFIGQCSYFIHRELIHRGGFLLSLFHSFEMLFDPVLMIIDKFLNLLLSCAHGYADYESFSRFNLES